MIYDDDEDFKKWFNKEYDNILKKSERYQYEYQVTGSESKQRTAYKYEYYNKVFTLAKYKLTEESQSYQHYAKTLRLVSKEIDKIDTNNIDEYKKTVQDIIYNHFLEYWIK